MAQVAANMLVSVILAIFAENALFSRALGVERTLLLVDDMGAMVTFGCLTTLSVTLTSLLTYLVSFPLQQDVNAYIYKPLLFILCMVAVYFALSGIARRIRIPRFVKWQTKVRPHFHLATFNSAVLGTLMLCSGQVFSLPQTVGFCLGSGAGYTLATLIVAEGQRKLKNRSVPASFQGLPVTLLYIGILSLCIYGFTGYQLSF
ncbi:NADH:ubiquinone oxidoreductase, subunit RnfA [Acetanaerobacterium sp. MSJ-12]|uniref:NADH:ubiquinone oxidoreductase, subunit RnfA n=1 Tax=Bittarella massiliensis (ex Durand et al. 2017) TaxID=1720313 RepID=A0AAW5KI12_9FIRM|nr:MULTISPECIES: Rnf-Nqr domain containing protein [Oscillospiraceae]MBC2871510.1 NADH:ubiquinone oxidoreductase, subunit RnfA [Bittarella massiliensis (ex Durand et al. 2017)]MBU5418991.1 NADH:ubiquinone oxidoreductase, subunit RnfA [Acetanaerobacterium sp. MSJ-12]MCQ4949609.1 NADH:ubiquinone oxidoreductase, subunit RnfA [Bittarella massiliensis (ex Durand et al. 2017)]